MFFRQGRVIDAVAPETRRANVVGESFGGALAMSCALARPQQVGALVVVNSFPFMPKVNLRLSRFGLRLIPWSAMSLIRRATAFRFHSPSTHRDDIVAPDVDLAEILATWRATLVG